MSSSCDAESLKVHPSRLESRGAGEIARNATGAGLERPRRSSLPLRAIVQAARRAGRRAASTRTNKRGNKTRETHFDVRVTWHSASRTTDKSDDCCHHESEARIYFNPKLQNHDSFYATETSSSKQHDVTPIFGKSGSSLDLASHYKSRSALARAVGTSLHAEARASSSPSRL